MAASPFDPIEETGYWCYTNDIPWKKRICVHWLLCGERHRCHHVLPHYPNRVCALMCIWSKEDTTLCKEVVVDDEDMCKVDGMSE